MINDLDNNCARKLLVMLLESWKYHGTHGHISSILKNFTRVKNRSVAPDEDKKLLFNDFRQFEF